MSGPVEGSPPDPTRKATPSARAAWMVGAGIFLSRLSGLARETSLAFFFGASSGVLDVWRVALRTPNVIQNLLGEGTLSASFIPVYSQFLEQGREEDAGRFAGAVLGLLATVAFGLALVGVLAAPWLIRLLLPLWEPWQHELGTTVIRILFLVVAFQAVSAWALGILNSHRKFFVSYVAPTLWNGAMVTTLLVFGGTLAFGQERLLVALAWGAFVGGVLQFAVQLPWVVPVLRGFRLSTDTSVEGIKRALSSFWPVVAARGIINLSAWLDYLLAGLLASGAITILGFAQVLYMLPIALFGMAIAASELPQLSRARELDHDLLRPRVRTALERVAYLLVPSLLAYLVLGDVFIAALFEHGAFVRDETTVAYAVLAAYAVGMWASAGSRALSSAFYAIRDTRTPARIAAVRVVLSLVVGVSLMFPLDGFALGDIEDGMRFGAVGLAVGASAGAWLEYRLLRRSLTRTLGRHGPAGSVLLRVWAGALAAAVAGFGAKRLFGSVVPMREGWAHALVGPDSWLVYPIAAAGTGLAFGVTYLLVTTLLGIGPRSRGRATQA